jgi:hypothetical protein
MNRSVKIYEPIYAPGQVLTESSFHPLALPDNAHAPWREFYILTDMYRRGLHRQQDLTGLFSPKFALKARISGDRFLEFVHSNPDADVCLINPFPQLRYSSFNSWMHGENAHPGLMERAQALLDACDVKWSIKDAPRQGADVLCYCNFWIGTEEFWDEYVGKVLVPIATFLEENSQDPMARSILQPTIHSDNSPFLPFIAERLFSTFLSLNSSVNISSYPIMGEDVLDYCVTEYERDVVRYMQEAVDLSDQKKSFSPDQIALMNLLCKLSQRYTFAYFATNVHPHTGQTIQFLGEKI